MPPHQGLPHMRFCQGKHIVSITFPIRRYWQASCYIIATVTLANPIARRQGNLHVTSQNVWYHVFIVHIYAHIHNNSVFTCVRYASRFAFGSLAQTFIEIIYLLIFYITAKNMKVSMNAITRSSTCFLRQRERGEVSVWKSMLHCILFNIFTCQFHSSAFVHFNC